jgi:hypothetical protein
MKYVLLLSSNFVSQLKLDISRHIVSEVLDLNIGWRIDCPDGFDVFLTVHHSIN